MGSDVEIVTLEWQPFIGISELESGRYRIVTHSKYFEIEEGKEEDAKREWARSVEEQGEGAVIVESVTFRPRKAGKVKSGWIALSGAEVVEEDHTVIETVFRVESPFPFTLLLIAIIVAIIVIAAFVFRGEIAKLVDVLYEYPEVAVGLGIVLILALIAVAAKPVVERIRRREGG